MTIKNKMISACLMCLVVFSVVGCSPKDVEKSNNFISSHNMELIYEETISPNKEYVEKEEDIVNYTVEVYQDDDHMIFVNANSNFAGFQPLQYEVEAGTDITKEDIDIEWTTIMGNPTPTKEDLLAIAYVSISEDGEVISKRKISFINKAIEILEDALDKKLFRKFNFTLVLFCGSIVFYLAWNFAKKFYCKW